MSTGSSATTAVRDLYSRFVTLGRSWPADPLRPDVHFGKAIEGAAYGVFVGSRTGSGSSSVGSGSVGGAQGAAGVQTDGAGAEQLRNLSEREVEYANQALEALLGIRDDRALKEVSSEYQVLASEDEDENEG